MASARGKNPLEEVTYLPDKKGMCQKKNNLKEDIPESKKRTNKGLEILSNSVCVETASSVKAENVGKWDSFGIKGLEQENKKGNNSPMAINAFYGTK